MVNGLDESDERYEKQWQYCLQYGYRHKSSKLSWKTREICGNISYFECFWTNGPSTCQRYRSASKVVSFGTAGWGKFRTLIAMSGDSERILQCLETVSGIAMSGDIALSGHSQWTLQCLESVSGQFNVWTNWVDIAMPRHNKWTL